MTQRQLGLAESLVDPRLGSNPRLAKLETVIDWAPLEVLCKPLRRGEHGRPPYAPLALLKALYLQAMYDLSDPGLEEALLDRLSFRRFCGFGLADRTPDETTILRFRHDAAEAGVLRACFEEITRQLEQRGLMVKKGSLLDATLVASALRPPPASAGLGACNAAEPGASWTRKAGRSVFGYKVHVGVDQGSGLVRRVVVTGAETYESEAADDLICGDERAVYADKAYPQAARRQRLRAAGIKDRIMHRRHKSQRALPRHRQRWNDLVARARAAVENIFSQLKRIYGRSRMRCHTLARNTADILAIVSVLNLKRAAKLTAA